MDASCFCVAGAALGATPERSAEVRRRWVLWALAACAWHVQRLEDLSLILRGRPSTQSISASFGVAGAALGAPPERSAEVRRRSSTMGRVLLRGRCSTWRTSVSFCVAGAALRASDCHLAWQVQHWEHLQRGLRKSGDDWVLWAPAAFAWQVQRLEDLSLIVRGSSCSIFLPFCTSTQHHLDYIVNTTPTTRHLKTQHQKHTRTPSTLHHQHNIINTTSSTHHHLHNTIYTTPSTQHHPHNTMYTTSSHTGSCSTWSTAILSLLPHSCWYPSCYSSLWFLLCSVSLTFSTLGCRKTLLTCGVIRSYNYCFNHMNISCVSKEHCFWYSSVVVDKIGRNSSWQYFIALVYLSTVENHSLLMNIGLH